MVISYICCLGPELNGPTTDIQARIEITKALARTDVRLGGGGTLRAPINGRLRLGVLTRSSYTPIECNDTHCTRLCSFQSDLALHPLLREKPSYLIYSVTHSVQLPRPSVVRFS